MPSITSATFSFLSWVRQGLAAGSGSGGLAVKDGHLSLPVRLRVNDSTLTDVPVQLYGPGDVVGIDSREIVRVEPQNLMREFEPNYFPFIEFDHPDFPWMFTPATVDSTGKLQPWICLVAVRKDTATLTMRTNQPLPILDCLQQELPDLGEAWAWAHAQVTRSAAVPDLEDALARQDRTISRLLCPRRLDPNTDYYACLVPTFEVGRRSGLGENFTLDDEKALRAAWLSLPDSGVQTRVRLPVYYHWEFSTGAAGDFEALARRLQSQPLPATVGVREINISSPGWGVGPFPPNSAGAVIEMEGALRNPNVRAKDWANDVRVPFQTKLRLILDTSGKSASAGGNPPLVGPPLYGQWYPKLESLLSTPNPPLWLTEVNLEPGYRIAAGLGAMVIRYQQEELMTSAWDQLAAQQADNEQLKRAQLSEAVGQALVDKHLAPLSAQRLVQVTAPIHNTVVQLTAAKAASGQTRAAVSPTAAAPKLPTNEAGLSSILRAAGSSAAFRRLSRGRGPIARRLAGRELKDATSVTRKPASLGGPPSVAVRSTPVGARTSASATNQGHAPVAFTGFAAVGLPLMKSQLLDQLNAQSLAPEAVQQAMSDMQGTELVRFNPVFPQPMYEPLRDYFAEMLLPGMENVPPNSVALLETNPRFVEAYMIGLNHEMSRELLWRDYPADRRGTYFRQFWDVSGRVPPPTPLERSQLADIAPISEWRDDTHLGDHSLNNNTSAQIVLIIRGDLIHRYPRAIIYAVEGVWSSNQSDAQRVPGTKERYPMFRVTRAPDITMLGFTLSKQEARGADTPPANPPGSGAGWFFVLQEQPTEPRYGLDVPTAQTFGAAPAQWSELSWGHLAASPEGLKQIIYVPVKGTLNGRTLGNATWGKNSAHMASIFRQSPFRLVIHARTWLSA